MRRSLALSLIMSLFVAASAFATGEARLTGKIIDAATRQPIPNATYKIEAVEGKTVKKEDKGRKDGGYTVFLLDGTIKYKFTFSAPGYAPYEETMKLKLGEPEFAKSYLEKIKKVAATSKVEFRNHTAARLVGVLVGILDGEITRMAGDVPGAQADRGLSMETL